ncbi:hypothetical protein [Flavobacterium anhuiense]|uniref:hypothetical protein n=1 Tax=Flavobacterium anhuiense TaxID=459526 RepID=UPI003D988335
MFRTLLIIISFFLLQTVNANKLSNRDKVVNLKTHNCSLKNATVKSEVKEKDRKFIFWKLPHKKIIIVDRIIDTNGKTILKKKSVHICSLDACDTRKFRRLKIIENEIWIFQYNTNPEKAIIKRYDSCRKYLNQKKWDKDKSFEDY